MGNRYRDGKMVESCRYCFFSAESASVSGFLRTFAPHMSGQTGFDSGRKGAQACSASVVCTII